MAYDAGPGKTVFNTFLNLRTHADIERRREARQELDCEWLKLETLALATHAPHWRPLEFCGYCDQLLQSRMLQVLQSA
jgi:hypothetical protein